MPGGLRTQILFLSLLPPLAIALVLGVYLAYSHLQDLQNYTQARGQALTIQLGITAQQALLDQDLDTLRQLSDASLEESGVRAISFFDPDGRQLSHSGPLLKLPPSAADFAAGKNLQRTEQNIDVFFAPVYRQLLTSNLHNGLASGNNVLLGWIAVEYNRNDIVIQKHHRLLMQNMLIMLALLLSGLLGIRLGQSIANDIKILNNSIKRIKEGEPGDPEAVSSSHEMQQLANNIRDMAEHLQNEFDEMRHNLEISTNDLKETIETMEVQNIELGLAKKEALTASKIKSEFLANTSHEIRTPLNGIVGFATILKKTSLNKQQHEYVDTIHRSSENLLTIINDILDFSKIEAGKLELELAPFNIRQLMEECLNLFAPQAYEKNIEMVLMIYQDVPLYIVGDALRIKQIVSNLLSNAVKFTHQGTIALRVSLEQACDDQAELGISVSDSGIGMTALQQKNIFQAFTQANSSISREYGGTGLGLAIVKKLVELMHDEIRVESRPNQGSTFSFVLKAQIAEHQHDNYFQELHKRTILVFEKHELLNLAIQHLLSSWSVNVLSATSSAQANTLLAEHYVDLIIVGLSQVHDYAVQANEIESLSRHSKPLLLLTSSQAEKQISQLYNGTPFISYKPVTETRLYQNIVDILYPHKNRLARMAQKPGRQGDLLQVLAVDDHQPNLKLLNILLHDLGCKVSNAADGREAITICKQQVFDIIFMDIQMPVINGLNATRAIREEESLNNNTPIIALTAHAMADERDAIFKTGMNDYITKPVNEEQLLTSIRKWCRPAGTVQDSCVDVALCLKLANYKQDLACELFALLAESLPTEIEKISAALEQDDKLLLEHVHRLHGASCYTGVPALKSAAQRFEFAIKNSDRAQYPSLLDNLLGAATAIINWHKENDFAQQLSLTE